jgi:hypothetical protein
MSAGMPAPAPACQPRARQQSVAWPLASAQHWLTTTRQSTLPLEPVAMAPSNIQALVRVRPLLLPPTVLPFGSSCSMSGYFFINAACFRLSAVLANMNSCAKTHISDDELDLLAALHLKRVRLVGHRALPFLHCDFHDAEWLLARLARREVFLSFMRVQARAGANCPGALAVAQTAAEHQALAREGSRRV